MRKRTSGPLPILPTELWILLFEYLMPPQVAKMSQVNKAFCIFCYGILYPSGIHYGRKPRLSICQSSLTEIKCIKQFNPSCFLLSGLKNRLFSSKIQAINLYAAKNGLKKIISLPLLKIPEIKEMKQDLYSVFIVHENMALLLFINNNIPFLLDFEDKYSIRILKKQKNKWIIEDNWPWQNEKIMGVTNYAENHFLLSVNNKYYKVQITENSFERELTAYPNIKSPSPLRHQINGNFFLNHPNKHTLTLLKKQKNSDKFEIKKNFNLYDLYGTIEIDSIKILDVQHNIFAIFTMDGIEDNLKPEMLPFLHIFTLRQGRLWQINKVPFEYPLGLMLNNNRYVMFNSSKEEIRLYEFNTINEEPYKNSCAIS